jgi:hypothetical protein
MLVLFYVWILLKKPLGTILACFNGVLCYFTISGTARLFVVLDPAQDTWFITVYFFLQLSFVGLLLVMIREEGRSSW